MLCLTCITRETENIKNPGFPVDGRDLEHPLNKMKANETSEKEVITSPEYGLTTTEDHASAIVDHCEKLLNALD